MDDDMLTTPIAEDPIEKLKSSFFSQTINTAHIALAVLGWITNMTVTEVGQ